jgi:NAD-dependent SIR2 family protein deacetylase
LDKRKIKCYLCRQEAEERDTDDTTMNVLVKCPECSEYILSYSGMKYYFERPEGSALLKPEHKKKLSINVKNHFNKKGEPLLLNTKKIEDIIGVKIVTYK